jgi:hypothetical protein
LDLLVAVFTLSEGFDVDGGGGFCQGDDTVIIAQFILKDLFVGVGDLL